MAVAVARVMVRRIRKQEPRRSGDDVGIPRQLSDTAAADDGSFCRDVLGPPPHSKRWRGVTSRRERESCRRRAPTKPMGEGGIFKNTTLPHLKPTSEPPSPSFLAVIFVGLLWPVVAVENAFGVSVPYHSD